MKLKKPKFWDYKYPSLYAYALIPIAILIKIFNFFNRKSIKYSPKIKIICVGNIYIGGTGKTSLCVQLNKILTKRNINSCFVKKYYKNQIDEEKILKKNGKLFLSKKRVDAIKQAEKEDFKYAILDDGLQDKTIKKDISLICFNTINWIGNGMTIPSGPLRENIHNLKKYEHVFLNGNLENLENLKNEIFRINSKINIHIGKYEITNFFEFNLNKKFLVFSGIGNHETFISMMIKNKFKIIKDIEFPDHYEYSNNDIDKILKESIKLDCEVVTTEKDFNRLNHSEKSKIKILKTELKIIDEEKLMNSITTNEKY